jgi:hypothetical protein
MLANEALRDRIGDLHEDDGNGAGALLDGRQVCCGGRQNYVGHQPDQLRRIDARERGVAGIPANIDAEILAFGPPRLLQGLEERGHIRLRRRFGRDAVHQHSHTAHRTGLLRARHERQCRRAAEKPYELTSPHIRTQGPALYRLKSTLIGLKPGVKTIAAVHSQCRWWVIERRTRREQNGSAAPQERTLRLTGRRSPECHNPTHALQQKNSLEPIQAAKSRPDRNDFGSVTVAAMALAPMNADPRGCSAVACSPHLRDAAP